MQAHVISAGFASTPYSHSYALDTTAPTTTVATKIFSADTGSSSTDFITKTAAQTVSGTLSATLAADEIVQVSLDNGSTWAPATTTTGQNTWSLAGQTLTASDTLKIRVMDTAGNTGPLDSHAYVLDTTAPATTITTIALSTDTGTDTADFITKTAAQDISGTLSANMVAGDIVQVSLDNGGTWVTASTTVGQNTWSLAAQTLVASNTLKVRVTDAAGNGGTERSQVYALDTSLPTASVTSANVSINTNVTTSQSTETGIVYLVKTSVTPTDYASLETAVTGGNATKATVTTGGSNTPIGTTGLPAGTYKVYAVDAAGNVSAASGNTITLVLNQLPVITSNSGTSTASINVPENTNAVTTITATDADSDTVSFSITGGSDSSKFSLNATTGALSLASAPNFEAPTDSNKVDPEFKTAI